MNSKDILENYLNQMVDAHSQMSEAKSGLLAITLSPFEELFRKDSEGNMIATRLQGKDLQEVLDSFDNDLIPLFEESKYEEGIKQIEEWKKILEKNLEEQK